MELEPELTALAARLAELAAKGTVTGIRARIATTKAARRDQETIEVLDEIIEQLISDRTEILGIAQAFEDELIAEQVSDADIEFITSQLAPKVESLIEMSGTDADPEQMRELLSLFVSKETVKILQLLGFNFREAIGRPLTDLVSRFISTQGPSPVDDQTSIQRLGLENQLALATLAQDQAAYERFLALVGSR